MRSQLLQAVLDTLGCLSTEETADCLNQTITAMADVDVEAELNRWQTLSKLETAYADGGIELP